MSALAQKPTVQLLDVNVLATAMATAMAASLTPVVAAILQERDSRHGLRNEIQRVLDKASELDTEVRLLKGVQVQLMGDGSGSSGMLPSLQRESVKTQNDISELKSDMKLVKDSQERMEASIANLTTGQSQARTFMDGGRGIVFFFGVMATLCTVIGCFVAAVIWLYTVHGAPK